MKKKYIGYFALLLSFAFIFIGIARGEGSMMFEKAIAICLECVGIG